jgi:hypothetical protein
MHAEIPTAEQLAAKAEPALLLRDGNLLACVVAPAAAGLPERLTAALEQLREASARESVRKLGLDRGYRLEDLTAAELRLPPEDDASVAEAFLRRRLPREAQLRIARGTGPLALAAAFAARIGGAPSRDRYAREADGRLRVEAFELHVAEHCNLRCANCCNMSPLVPERFLSLEETRALCERMSRVLIADVFKIMGGEPLLHPDIAGVLRAVRSTTIGDRVRLFTNGLLLPAMTDAFWEALDELTISDYTSARLKPAVLELAHARAVRHGFVLNVKPVREFSQVLSPRFRRDDAQVRSTFERCWLRHRCLIVRGGRFYMCTRAAYAEDFLAHAAHDEVPAGMPFDRSRDGIPLDAPDLVSELEEYLNRSEPLAACRFCFGSDGAVEAHYQLKRAEVRGGLLSRALRVVGDG